MIRAIFPPHNPDKKTATLFMQLTAPGFREAWTVKVNARQWKRVVEAVS